eukprot:m.667021 g.667021  ORF g.667021 m.667021 type:complete len:513 (+) comp58506_c0_seq10:1361-2899(+)
MRAGVGPVSPIIPSLCPLVSFNCGDECWCFLPLLFGILLFCFLSPLSFSCSRFLSLATFASLGSSSWIDFLNPSARNWWSRQFSLEEYEGSSLTLHTWNDMNEPSVFNGPEITMRKDARHYGDVEHRDVHNIYGMLQHAATAQGLLQRSPHRIRPFVLSRAFFAGTQRYGAIWTGDNAADWSHLVASIPMLLSISVSGIHFVGADIGGFFGNPSTELLIRWYQVGAFQPFMRAHAHIDTKRREPYLYELEDLTIMREAIRLRYTFLPFWYTCFYRSADQGLPVMRPLWSEFPSEWRLFAEERSFMIGSALLVAPVLHEGHRNVLVTFPGENPWYNVFTYERYSGQRAVTVSAALDTIPVFQHGGTIVPRKMRRRRSSRMTHRDPFTLTVALSAQESAVGELYVDDYTTLQYETGNFALRTFSFSPTAAGYTFTSRNGKPDCQSSFQTSQWIERIIVVGLSCTPTAVSHRLPSETTASIEREFVFDSALSTLTIKKPAESILTDFDIIVQCRK